METSVRSAILAILRPLVRYLIGRGWTYPVLSELLKEIYLTEALKNHGGPERGPTHSRISLLTGLHRKDVKRLRTTPPETSSDNALQQRSSLPVRVVAAWVSTPRFQDRHSGEPRTLSIRPGGNGPSFEQLVKSVRADMRPNVILEELLQNGAVQITGDQVRLLRLAYIPAEASDKLAFLGANVGDHLLSALHNVEAKSEPFIERAVFYSAIRPEDMARLRPQLRDLAEQFLRQVNSRVMPASGDARPASGDKSQRMRLGVYYYEEAVDTSPTTTPRAARKTRQKRNAPATKK